MPRLATHLKSVAAAAAVAALLPGAASAAPHSAPARSRVDASQITTGPDGAAWFTGGNQGVRPDRPATGPSLSSTRRATRAVPAITASPNVNGGPNTRVWLAFNGGVIKVDPANPNAAPTSAAPRSGAGSGDMAADGDGNLWVIDSDGVVKVTTAAAPPSTTGSPAPAAARSPLGGDGRMWWAYFGGGKIQATTTAGVTTKATALTSGAQGIAAGPGNQMAFGQPEPPRWGGSPRAGRRS